jgi:hypothetical protein
MTLLGTQLAITDPYALRRLEACQRGAASGESPPVRTAADVIGEQRMFAALVRHPAFAPALDGSVVPASNRFALADRIEGSTAFYYPNELDKMIRAMPMPAYTIAPIDRPAEFMWVSYEGSHRATDAAGKVTETDALLIGPLPDGLGIYRIGMWGASLFFLKWGMQYPVDFGAGTIGEHVIKFLAFLNSPYTTTEPRRPERAARREARRMGDETPTDDVHFIKLRQAVTEAVRQEAASRHVEWKHRWWVRGHFRAQWLPSKQAHRLTWIAPYIKGPDGADFTTPVYAVVR